MNQVSCPITNVTVAELLKAGENILEAYGKPDAKVDAKILLANVLYCKMSDLILERSTVVPSHIRESYMYLVAKRSQGIPVQYITKNQEFMGLPFYVDERVLIPRQDTETLVEEILQISKHQPLYQVVEIGVGSGCISVSLAHYIKDISITAMDISPKAIDVAKKNASHNKVEEKIHFLESDVFSRYKGEEESLDLVVSNPPYISKVECRDLMEEVKNYEPRIALTDEADGLSFYKQITKEAYPFLKKGGILAYEIGYNQGESVAQIVRDHGYHEVKVIKDLCQHDRVVIAVK